MTKAVGECKEKCSCENECGRIDVHNQHQCQKCHYEELSAAQPTPEVKK